MSKKSIDPSRRAFVLPTARRVSADGRPAPRVARVGAGCLAEQRIECRLCGDGCDTGAIRFVPRAGGVAPPSIDAARCTGCADCLPLCPTGALRLA